MPVDEELPTGYAEAVERFPQWQVMLNGKAPMNR